MPLSWPNCLIVTSVVSLGVSPMALAEEPAPPPRQILLEKPVELASNKVTTRMVRVAFPKGYKTPLHTHEGPGPRYVLRGRVKIEEGGKINEYGPGETFWETGEWMTVENVTDGEAELLIVELVSQK